MATVAEHHEHKPWSMARVIIASSAGTAFEWYDFFIFGSLAPVISKVFFAGLEPTAALIAALALFAVGFAFRPLGCSHLRRHRRQARPQGRVPGDRDDDGQRDVPDRPAADLRAGRLDRRNPADPTAHLQGIALGGEYGGAAIYVAEHAPNGKRGASTGWIQSSASFGLFAALLVIVATRTAIGEDAFAAWGWRIPFLVSAVLLANLGLDARQARRKPGVRPHPGRRRHRQGTASRSLRQQEESQARAGRFLRHHVRTGRRLVLHLLLHAGVSRAVARPARPDQGPAADHHDRR